MLKGKPSSFNLQSISLTFGTMKLLRTRITIAFGLCSAVLLLGTVGYMAIEGYRFSEGLYMSAITMSTVGFGEVRPLSEIGRTFTVCLILMSFISLAFAGHALGESLLEKVWSGQAGRKKMRKQLENLKNHYIICGFGRVGASAAAHFDHIGVDFVIIEANETRRPVLQDKGLIYIEGDATHEDVLAEAGIKKAKGLLAMLNSDPDNLFIVLTAREMNPTLKIIARAGDTSSGHKIIRAGADDVVSPFTNAGTQIANDMLKATGRIVSSDGADKSTIAVPHWVDITPDSGVSGQTIGHWCADAGRTVIGLRRNSEDIIYPDTDTVLLSDDQLLVIMNPANDPTVERHRAGKKRKRLVLIDDNPVITKLYTRLFQKAGFVPLPAFSGREGLEVILKEKPQAAVIDYLLPDMSGIEVCRKVRHSLNGHPIKLILFTADSSAQTRQKAIDAGADAVVVKSPEASEVIRTVTDILGR